MDNICFLVILYHPVLNVLTHNKHNIRFVKIKSSKKSVIFKMKMIPIRIVLQTSFHHHSTSLVCNLRYLMITPYSYNRNPWLVYCLLINFRRATGWRAKRNGECASLMIANGSDFKSTRLNNSNHITGDDRDHSKRWWLRCVGGYAALEGVVALNLSFVFRARAAGDVNWV